MTRREIYVNLENTLSKLDLPSYWRGFHIYPFALYDNDGVSLESEDIEWDERFYGNTAIEFGGKRMAIWNVDGMTDPDIDILAADIVHEMFHAFQFDSGETRFPNDLKLMCCPWDADYFGLKAVENRILAQSLAAEGDELIEMLRTFFGIRRLRAELGGVMEQELLTETGEGMAEFVGCQALMELAPEKFFLRIRDYAEKLGNYSEGLFDLRRNCYYSGVALMFAAAQAGVDFRHEIGSTDMPVAHMIETAIGCDIPEEVVCDRRVKLGMEAICRDRRVSWQEFADKTESIVGDWTICGYDPMNMSRLEDMIFSKGFIMLRDNGTGETVRLMGGALLAMETDSHNRVERYWK